MHFDIENPKKRKRWKKEEIDRAIELRKNGYTFKKIAAIFQVTSNAASKALQRHWSIYKKRPIIAQQKSLHQYVTEKYMYEYGLENELWQENRSLISNIIHINFWRSQQNLPLFILRSY